MATMSKALKTVGTIAAGIALVATGVGAFAAAGSALAATAGSIATYAGVAAGVANVGAQLTAPKPVARGSINNTIIAVEPPRPYMMGRTYFGGILRHRTGYGATLKKVPNPYLWRVMVYSGVGPVEELVEEQFDFKPIGSYYSGFYGTDTQLGARPETTALVPPLDSPATGWGSASKLSGCAAIGWNYKFDKDGKVFASGVPVTGAIWKGEKCYDPRLDTTRTGGSGAHRVDDETTWAYSANPALHAATYVFGRYEGTQKIFGIGVGDDGIDWDAVSAWANDCDANGWEVSGVIFEGGDASGPQQKARNLEDICAAGSGQWLMAGAVLSFDWQRPRVPLATITDADLMEEGASIVTLQSHRDRFNAVLPQYTSESHNWEQVTGDKITNATYQTEDGEEKLQSWPLNLVAKNAQAGQLATYAMADSREIGPIQVTLGVDYRFYRPGDCLRIESEASGLESDVVVARREIDPVSLKTAFTMKGETNAKHAYALGETAVSPPTPVIGQTGEERDAVAGYLADPRAAFRIRSYSPAYPITPGDSQIAIAAFDGTLEDGRTISFPAETETGLTASAFYAIFYDLVGETYSYDVAPGTAKLESSRYVYVGSATTSSGGTFPTPSTPPDGWSGDPNYQEP